LSVSSFLFVKPVPAFCRRYGTTAGMRRGSNRRCGHTGD
jgi:hypothetical protein